jgi:hypothetical protein
MLKSKDVAEGSFGEVTCLDFALLIEADKMNEYRVRSSSDGRNVLHMD